MVSGSQWSAMSVVSGQWSRKCLVHRCRIDLYQGLALARPTSSVFSRASAPAKTLQGLTRARENPAAAPRLASISNLTQDCARRWRASPGLTESSRKAGRGYRKQERYTAPSCLITKLPDNDINRSQMVPLFSPPPQVQHKSRRPAPDRC